MRYVLKNKLASAPPRPLLWTQPCSWCLSFLSCWMKIWFCYWDLDLAFLITITESGKQKPTQILTCRICQRFKKSIIDECIFTHENYRLKYHLIHQDYYLQVKIVTLHTTSWTWQDNMSSVLKQIQHNSIPITQQLLIALYSPRFPRAILSIIP